jgi:hypothetical protein
MELSPQSPNGAAAGRLATRIAMLLLSVTGGTCLILDAMANLKPVQDWMRTVAWQQSKSKKQIPLFCWNEHFIDYEDRLLHKEIPSADFSEGGVFFMGASNMKWALKLWDLPAETRPFIRNFAFGGSKHSDQLDLLRYLVERQGFLRAGGEKTLIVLGVNYRNAHHARLDGEGRSEYFERLWTRHGFYVVEPDGSIRPSGLSGLARQVILERTKITGLLKELANLAFVPLKSIRVQDRQAYSRIWADAMGPRWEEMIRVETAAFAGMVAYLQRRNVRIVVVRLPVASWEDDLPFERTYIHQIRSICESSGIQIYDFSRLLDDDDFADSIHLNPVGIEKFQRAVIGIALNHLHSTGTLPASDTESTP